MAFHKLAFHKVLQYFHIYFNNNKEDEIKRNFINKDEKIKIIKVIIDYPIKSFENLFIDCHCIEFINFKKFVRNNIIDMSYMFNGCLSLKELNLNNFNTINVTNMSGMFFNCFSLKEIYLDNFNTNNVTDMSCMFYRCSSLKVNLLIQVMLLIWVVCFLNVHH